MRAATTSRLCAMVVATTLLLSGCIPGVDGLGDPPVTERTVEQLTGMLERGGIAVEDEPDASAASFATHTIVLMSDQVTAMANQIVNKSGYTGFQLDELTLLEEPLPPFSYLIAGWARDHDGEGAKVARELLDEQDWTNPARIIWPDAALALYLADMTADVPREARLIPGAAAGSIATVSLHTLDVGALCSGAASFVQTAIASVFAAIEAAAKAAEQKVGGLFGKIVGLGIRLFNELVTDALKVANEVTSALLAPVRQVIAIVAVLQEISSAIKPWAVAMSPTPATVVASQSPQTGDVTASVTTQGLGDYPAWVRQCGTALGLTFPDPPGVGTKVDWTVESWPKGVTTVTSDAVVQKDNTVKLTFQVPAEDPDQADGIPVTGGSIEVSLKPNRDQLDALNALADNLIGGVLAEVPTVIRTYVAGIVAGFRNDAVARIKQFLTPSSTSQVAIPYTFHLPKKPDPEKAETRPRPAPDPNWLFCTLYGQWIVDYRASAPPDIPGRAAWGDSLVIMYEYLAKIAPEATADDINAFLAADRRADEIDALVGDLGTGGQSEIEAGLDSLGLLVEQLEVAETQLLAVTDVVGWAAANCKPFNDVFQRESAELQAFWNS